MAEFRTEPYFDYDAVTQEMADDLHAKLRAFGEAQRLFSENGCVENARTLMRTRFELAGCEDEIRTIIWTEPVTVHVAGPREEEEDDHEEGHEGVLYTQRCARCKTVLSRWCEHMPVPFEAMPWWPEGAVVGKFSYGPMVRVELIGDRDLEKHEVMCPDFDLVTDGSK
jgi:hypothetical protein